MQTERNKTLDTVKGIGILLVVLAHVCKNAHVQLAVYTFHMPLFFLAAGITFRPEKYRSVWDLCKKKYKGWIRPYLIFCFLGIAYQLLNLLRSHAAPAAYKSFLLKAGYSVVWASGSLKYFSLFNTSMWFIPCLLLVEILYFLLARRWEGKKLWAWVLAISFAGWLMESKWPGIDFSFLPWNFSSGCYSLVFFAAGNRFGMERTNQYFFPVGRKERAGKQLVWMLVLAAVTLILGFWNGKVSIGSRILNNGLLFAVTGIAGSFAAMIFSCYVQNCRFLNFCGRNSFVIMGSHFMVTDVVQKLLGLLRRKGIVLLPHVSAGNAVEGTILAAIVVVFCCLFTLFYNRITKENN